MVGSLVADMTAPPFGDVIINSEDAVLFDENFQATIPGNSPEKDWFSTGGVAPLKARRGLF